MSLLNTILEATESARKPEPVAVVENNEVIAVESADVRDEARQSVVDGFPFSISKERLFGPNAEETTHFGLFRSDTRECLPTTVKSGYEPHTRDDVEALAEAAILGFDSKHDAKVTCRWSGKGHQVVVAPSREFRQSVYGTSDNVYPRAVINAPYGGSFQATFGVFRDLCSNLMLVRAAASDSVFSVRIRHTRNLRNEMEELIDNFHTLAESSESVYESIKQLEATRVQVADWYAHLYPSPEKDTKNTKSRHRAKMQSMFTRLIDERRKSEREQNDETASVWELLNSVTGYVQHDKSRRSNPSDVDRALIGIEDREAEVAFEYAYELASLSA